MRKRSGVPLNVLNLQEVVGIGGNIYYIYAYIVEMGQNGNPTYAKTEYIVGVPLGSLSIKHRMDRTIYSMENSHPKAYFANNEKQTQIFFFSP